MIDRMTEKTIRLLLEQKEPITTSVIANEIGVSRSSIKHNLDYVKKTLQKAGVLLNSIPVRVSGYLRMIISEKLFYSCYRRTVIIPHPIITVKNIYWMSCLNTIPAIRSSCLPRN